MICTVCLGDRSDATNEIIECDSCGVTVHEGKYFYLICFVIAKRFILMFS